MDYAKLRGKIIEKYHSLGNFAKEMGMNRSTLSLKLNDKGSWTMDEVKLAVALLDIKSKEINQYFFN